MRGLRRYLSDSAERGAIYNNLYFNNSIITIRLQIISYAVPDKVKFCWNIDSIFLSIQMYTANTV